MLPYLLFFVSGFAALAYQIIWQRLLVIFSGSDVEAATTIVAAFMAGLGCGSLAGGRLADRWSPAKNLAGFATAEIGIAAFGALSAPFFYDVLYRQFGHLAWRFETRAATLFFSLLWPTFLMGASLPLLLRALAHSARHAAVTGGRLYTVNTLGGAAGALTATWWLMPTFGLRASLGVCAILNLLVAAAALPIGLQFGRKGAARETPITTADPGSSVRPAPALDVPFAAWAVLYGLAGFLALSLEIVWFRLLGILLKSTAYVFGTLMAQYLIGLGVGAAAATYFLDRSRRPGWTFVFMQAGIGVYAGAGLLAVLALVGESGILPGLASYLATYEPLDVRLATGMLSEFLRGSGEPPLQFLTLYVLLPALLIGPPTMLMGAGFPLVQKVVQTDLPHAGRRIGTLLAANIAGSAIGSVATGWFALAWLGTAGTFKALLVVSAVFPLIGLTILSRARPQRRLWSTAVVIAAVVVLMVASPDAGTLWGRLHGASPASIVHGEDGSGTSVLRVESSTFRSRVAVFANGSSQSWIPYGGIHSVLGALPAFMHPDPRTAAVIGLGSGDTVFAIAGRPGIARIRCIEIVKPQLDTLKRLIALYRYPALDTILTDRRIEHVYGDGRLHVVRHGVKYDLIEADALRPTSAYSGNLYSDAYFAMLHDHLTPGGFAVTWAPTPRVRDTFIKVFPHVLGYDDFLIGSNAPIEFHPETIRQRLSEPGVREHFDLAGIDIARLLEPYLTKQPLVFEPADDRSHLQDINTDLFPKDEFGVPHASHN